MAWAAAAIITVFGALSYGELAAMYPAAGGQYVYLKEIYGKLIAFLYGWSLFTVIQTGTIAAVAVAFAKYSGVFFDAISDKNYLLEIGKFNISTQQLLGVVIIWVLTIYNFREVKTGAILQNILTTIKVISLLGLILIGIIFGIMHPEVWQANWAIPALPDNTPWLGLLTLFGAAMTGSLFSSDSWNNITFTAGEINNPKRDLPLSLVFGTGTVTGLYLLANISYLSVLPTEAIAHADNDRVATALMQVIVGNWGKWLMAAMIMVSTFGCLNGCIFTAGRVYYAMAKDKLFLPQAAMLNKNGVPQTALIMQASWASLLALSGSYGNLLNYIMFSVLLFYILTVAGVFVLRFRLPDADRPYRTFGYPLIPALYVLLTSAVCCSMLYENAEFAGYGLGLILFGIPVFYLTKYFTK
jgi:APA family basic amino acid/polyamine antiporter